MSRRVVVTGLGIISPLGCSVKSAWQKLINGEHGIQSLNDSIYSHLPCRVAALVPKDSENGDLNINKHFSKSEQKSISLASLYALRAASDALQDADWFPSAEKSKQRTGVCVGMGMVDLTSICESYDALKKSYSKVSPFFVPRILANMAAGHISIKYGFQGPNHSVSTACATGCHSIGDAFYFIKRDMADVMICGGTEACVTPLAIAGFCRLRALSVHFNDSPGEASRPFDTKRDGFVMGEGASVMVLEELEHALKRNVKIYGEILGYGLSGDATHITAPHDEGIGAQLSMIRALKDANVLPQDVTYVNAHATSTPLGDAVELKAIKNIFHDSEIAVSSSKGAHGHLLGAAGNLESLFTILACHNGILPPTINLHEICEEAKGLNCVPNKQQQWMCNKKKIAIKNSFGFGGTNSSLCISEFIQ